VRHLVNAASHRQPTPDARLSYIALSCHDAPSACVPASLFDIVQWEECALPDGQGMKPSANRQKAAS